MKPEEVQFGRTGSVWLVPFEDIDDWNPALLTQWQKLLQQQESGSPFSHPRWLANWWSFYGQKSHPLVLACFFKGACIGVLPFQIEQKRWHDCVHWMGHPEATHQDPAVMEDAAELVVTAWFQYLDNQTRPMIFKLGGLPEHHGFSNALLAVLNQKKRTSLLSKEISPVIQVHEESYESYYQRMTSSHGRKNHRKQEWRLNALGEIRFQQMSREDLPAAFALHDLRWKEKWDTSRFTSPPSQAFYSTLLGSLPRNDTEATNGSWKAFALGMYFKEQLVAFQYGFRNDRRALFYKSAHDPAFNAFAPGKMMKRECIKSCFQAGIKTIDLGVGFEEYKAEWTKDQETLLQVVFPSKHIRSRILFYYYQLMQTCRNRLKQNRRFVLFKRNTLGKWRFRFLRALRNRKGSIHASASDSKD